MRDTCATRRLVRRVVELKVWDVLTLYFDEAPAGQLGGPVVPGSFQSLERSNAGRAVCLYLLGFEFASDAEECVDGSRTCISHIISALLRLRHHDGSNSQGVGFPWLLYWYRLSLVVARSMSGRQKQKCD
jgi:hypothetical protein